MLKPGAHSVESCHSRPVRRASFIVPPIRACLQPRQPIYAEHGPVVVGRSTRLSYY